MATPYSDVYERAVFRFSDASLLQLTDEDKESILEKYLNSACARFKNVCRVDLMDRDESLKQFNADLDDEVLEILALGVAYYWLSSKVLRVELLRNTMSTKDFTTFSNANLLREATALRDAVRDEFIGAINAYSYYDGSISKLKA